MASFRKSSTLARHAVSQLMASGQSRAATRNQPGVSSIATGNRYRQSLSGFAAHLQQHNRDLKQATVADAQQWLTARAGVVGQKALDADRQAVRAWLAHRGQSIQSLTRSAHPSQANRPGLAQEQRYYTAAQLDRIQARQSPANRLATQVAREAGLRAAEIRTIARAAERPADARDWRPDRFTGRSDADRRYTVIGKGGLVREIALSQATAERLESQRLAAPQPFTDRGIHGQQRYAIGGGQAWSKSFGLASRRALGWSRGAHSVRHVYADHRMEALQRQGYRHDEARSVVAQELGHFRDSTTNTYLRGGS